MTRPTIALSEETREKVSDRASYVSVIDRLSKASVDKHWDAYADVPWDDPDCQVDPKDPRWILPPIDRLGATEWYRSQPVEMQAEIGLWRTATAMKIGLQFENLLQRGLLTYAYKLRNGSPEYRYAMHELVEEGHHSMMFQEFVNRSGLPIRGMPKSLDLLARIVPWVPRLSTEMFFIFVLGGEDPIDYVQRKMLKNGHTMHPLAETIVRIHIAEEARHISFARHYLKHRVPKMIRIRRWTLGLLTPGVLGIMARIMLSPPGPMVRHYGIPKDVVREAYQGPLAKAEIRDCVGKLRELAVELGLVGPVSRRLWRANGIWDEPRAARTAGGKTARPDGREAR
ncbi:AurF N-oxygenase family protein [Actinomadura alba]|uniref:Diiron oxygenase n=1 Tax=Actinomadura alba TaxID=406431 RepID=A0ABR7LVR3_9ACTN|nr:diiron oxygenase [Actinomadura alba]MBC6468597.1 diiron oxygenase [Actinomadura alba]